MERIVEPELMDDPLQARAYAEADFDRSDQAFTERFLGLFGQPFPRPPAPAAAPDPVSAVGDGIVDLGCGPGNISFRLAAALPNARVLGVDGAASMVALAAEHQQRQQCCGASRQRELGKPHRRMPPGHATRGGGEARAGGGQHVPPCGQRSDRGQVGLLFCRHAHATPARSRS